MKEIAESLSVVNESLSEQDILAIKSHARNMRCSILRMLTSAKSGHPGGSLSATDILATLFFSGVMNYKPEDPHYEGRDRFLLSKGHAAPVLYAALHEAGMIPTEWLDTLRKLGSHLQGHPDMQKCPGVEASTGSLGQGLSIACGMALGLQMSDSDQSSNQRQVFVLTGDGELQEGQNWEALMFASHKKISNLNIIVDWNNLQIDGHVDEVVSLGDLASKMSAFGCEVMVCDGHDIDSLYRALVSAKQFSVGPVAILCKTIKGKGVSFMEDQCGWHGKAPSMDECESALSEIESTMAEVHSALEEVKDHVHMVEKEA